MEAGTEQSGYFTVLHANATSCCRQSQLRKQRKRREEKEREGRQHTQHVRVKKRFGSHQSGGITTTDDNQTGAGGERQETWDDGMMADGMRDRR